MGWKTVTTAWLNLGIQRLFRDEVDLNSHGFAPDQPERKVPVREDMTCLKDSRDLADNKFGSGDG